MGYSTCEDALHTILTNGGLASFTSANVSKGDYRILAKGITRALVLQPGPFTRNTQAAQGYMRTQWTIYLELYIPYGGEIATVATNIRSIRQAVIEHLDQYPTLNRTTGVAYALLQGAGEPEAWNDGRRYLFRQVMSMMVEERYTAIYLE